MFHKKQLMRKVRPNFSILAVFKKVRNVYNLQFRFSHPCSVKECFDNVIATFWTFF